MPNTIGKLETAKLHIFFDTTKFNFYFFVSLFFIPLYPESLLLKI